jgi:hypothetical protein
MAFKTFSACRDTDETIFHIDVESSSSDMEKYTFLQTGNYNGCVLGYGDTNIGSLYKSINSIHDDCDDCLI